MHCRGLQRKIQRRCQEKKMKNGVVDELPKRAAFSGR
jgi:hypothetical protein